MADNATSADNTPPDSGGSPPRDASTGNGVLQFGQKTRDENIGLILLELLLVATATILFLLQIEPAGTWGVAIIGAGALVLAVLTLSRVFPQSFWGILVAGAVLVYVASIAYQAGAPGRALQGQAWTTRSITIGSSKPNLIVSYPEQAPLQASDQPGLPLFVYFDGKNAAPGVNTSTAISFTLAFMPKRVGIVFTDDKGIPVLPQIAVRTGEQSSQPAALYIRSALTSTQPVTVAVALAARPDSAGAAWQELDSIDISTESTFHAWWRGFLGLLLGPATPILALVGTLLGFGWQWWQSEQQRRKAEQQAAIDRVTALAEVNPGAAALQYHQVFFEAEEEKWHRSFRAGLRECLRKLSERREQILLDCLQGIREERFQDCETQLAVVQEMDKLSGKTPAGSLRLAVEIELTYARNRDELWPAVSDRISEATKALFDSYGRYGRHAPELWIGPLADLAGRAESIAEFRKQIEKDERTRVALLRNQQIADRLEQLAKADSKDAKELLILREKRSPWLRDQLWPRSRPDEPGSVQSWLEKRNLAFNPFGPESADLDARLPDYVVDTVFAEARGKRAVLVSAAPGVGRTAAALSLAHECDDLPQDRDGSSPDSPKSPAFPIYYTLPVLGRPGSGANDHTQALCVAASRWLIKLIASKPHTFLEVMPKSRQMGLVYLLKTGFGSLSEVAYAFHRSDAHDVERVLREMQAMDAGSAKTRRISQDELPEVLVSALPAPYECIHILADVLTPSGTTSASEMAASLAPLVEMATPLAARDVYLKVFAPSAILSPIPAPTGCTKINLSWNEETLRLMLEKRLRDKDQKPVPFEELFNLVITSGDPAGMLVGTAVKREDAPRHLIRIGNALLQEHAEKSTETKIELAELAAVIKRFE